MHLKKQKPFFTCVHFSAFRSITWDIYQQLRTSTLKNPVHSNLHKNEFPAFSACTWDISVKTVIFHRLFFIFPDSFCRIYRLSAVTWDISILQGTILETCILKNLCLLSLRTDTLKNGQQKYHVSKGKLRHEFSANPNNFEKSKKVKTCNSHAEKYLTEKSPIQRKDKT